MNSSTLNVAAHFDWNIVAFSPNNIDRLMILISFHSNAASTGEHRCLARVKLGSPLFSSGSGSVHWQQFIARQSFSMWHSLNKCQT
jgi:hypothetical protein